MGVRSGTGAGIQARFVYAREEGDFICAAAPPPRLAPPRPSRVRLAAGTHPLPAPSSVSLLPLQPARLAQLGQRAAGACWGRRLLRKPYSGRGGEEPRDSDCGSTLLSPPSPA